MIEAVSAEVAKAPAEKAVALSVVICTYNNARWLAETLRHLAGQGSDLAACEVLVIDNNCTDETAEVVEEWRPAFAELRRLVETRQGQMHARVRGVRESRAPWIAFVDDDNFLEPGWLSAALRFAEAHPRCGVFGGKVVLGWEEPPAPVIAQRAYAYAATDLGETPRQLEGDERWLIRGAGMVCRKEALVAAGWLEWQLCAGRTKRGTMSGDDTEIVMRVAGAGYEVWYAPSCRLRHLITARRLTWEYLRSLHVSFAMADPSLLRWRTGSKARWLGALAVLALRRVYWLGRHSLRGLVSRDARATAILTYDSLRGMWRGLSAARRQRPTQRILHVQHGGFYGGIERMLACLAREQRHAPGLTQDFAFCHDAGLAEEIRQAGARVERLGAARSSRPWRWAQAVWRLYRLLGRESYSAVICHGSWPLGHFGIAARLRGVPLVLWMHNDSKASHDNFGEFLARRTRPDLVIANSAYTASTLPLLYPQTPRHTVLACPVSRPRGGASREAIRAEMKTPDEAVVIALVGRPEAWKGHVELLRALAQLREDERWICWIAGGAVDAAQASFVAELQAFAESARIAERVRFLGMRDDVAGLLAAADLFCQPNLTPEPFGIVFIEALYAGLPIIATDHGGAREIVTAACGRLTPPGNTAALTAALRELIESPALRESLSRQAPARAAEISDPAHVLPALQALLPR